MSRSHLPNWLRVCGLVTFAAHLALAQTTLSGRLSDPQGKPVAAAQLKLSLAGGLVVAQSPTNGAGEFTIAAPDGKYRMVVCAPGFADLSSDLTLPHADPLDLRF